MGPGVSKATLKRLLAAVVLLVSRLSEAGPHAEASTERAMWKAVDNHRLRKVTIFINAGPL